jgi:predicted metalloprotease with PDZ domain
VDDKERMLASGLLSHEFVHSWNGKYRRPADLATPDYQKTMQDDLLWVYEGLTSYLGDVLSGRSALRTPEELRDVLASMAAELDHTTGRTWRNLQDTADGVPAMQEAGSQWQSWRRALDYYDEDVFNWLWADVIIRQQTEGKKSLDDFCQLFHGAPSGLPAVKTYTFDDVMNTLNQVAPYDWRAFWTERLTTYAPGAPLTGLQEAGWKLVYTDKPSDYSQALEAERHHVDARYSIGLLLRSDGSITDSILGMPAAKVGVSPGMKVVAVNGRRFKPEVLKDALKAAKNASEPLALLVENVDYFKTYKVDYHGGERYPHLERDAAKPDLLSEITKAK